MKVVFSETRSFTAATAVVLLLVTTVYWPVHAAGFAWDDYKFLLDSGWMSDHSFWPQLVAHGFPEWASYYRPLGVVLYIVETNAAGFQPMPMHLLSLAVHLLDVVLVGLIARSLLRAREAMPAERRGELVAVALAMLIFGIHPAMVEPVVWISAQFDMLATLFMLAGLALDLRVHGRAARALGVAACFFMSALSKEAALAFPFLLAVFDYIASPGDPGQPDTPIGRVRGVLARQWPVYAATLLAGLAYLALRAWSIGFLVNPGIKPAWSLWPYLQTVCYTYLAYWKLILWPMDHLAPVHAVDAGRLASFSAGQLALDAAALAIVVVGVWLFRRRTAVGGLIAAVTAALLPVLHLIPLDFAASLYHNRYAMTAIAVACAFLPLVWRSMRRRFDTRAFRVLAVLLVWLPLALLNTRQCIPLWSDNISLWRWALVESPGDPEVMQSLLAAYARALDHAHARPLADAMMRGEQTRACLGCMLNVAALRVELDDAQGAADALAQAKQNMDRSSTIRHSSLSTYILLSGQVAELQHDDAEAEQAYRATITFNPQAAEAQLRLALLLARTGRSEEARRHYDAAMPLYLPAERARLKARFDALLGAGKARMPAPAR
jgi:tetratricopeptide (TPR) repeat protein